MIFLLPHSLDRSGPRCNVKAARCSVCGQVTLTFPSGPGQRACACAGPRVEQIDDPRAVNLSVQRLTLSLINTAAMERYHWWLHTGGRLPRLPGQPGRFRMGEMGPLDWRRAPS